MSNDLDARVAEAVLDHDVKIAKLKQSIHWLRERALRTIIEDDELNERERDAALITDLHAALKAARGEGEAGASLERMLLDDCAAYRSAGSKLAEAAMRVIRESDGLHRLSLAVSEWSTAIANEGGRDRHIAPDDGGEG